MFVTLHVVYNNDIYLGFDVRNPDSFSANNKVSDQSVHPCKISIFYLVSVAKHAGLSLTLSVTSVR